MKADPFSPDMLDFIHLLDNHGVRYVLIGGLADLRRTKAAAGRLKDPDDLENLPEP